MKPNIELPNLLDELDEEIIRLINKDWEKDHWGEMSVEHMNREYKSARSNIINLLARQGTGIREEEFDNNY